MLIGITGPAGVGKDTVGDYLVRTYVFEKLSWAAPMKAGLAAMGFPEPANRDDKEKLIDGFPFSWRQAAQRIGTEWGRGLDPDIWIKLLEQRLQRSEADAAEGLLQPHFVITDVRFDNEADMIRRRGGRIIHLSGRAVDLGEQASHASEAGVAKHAGDFHIVNNNGLSELEEEVDAIIRVLKKWKTA